MSIGNAASTTYTASMGVDYRTRTPITQVVDQIEAIRFHIGAVHRCRERGDDTRWAIQDLRACVMVLEHHLVNLRTHLRVFGDVR